MKKKIVTFLMLSLVAGTMVFAGCAKQGENKTEEKESELQTEEMQEEKEETEASSGVFGTFTSQTLQGEEVNQDIFQQADLTMVNIWGTFCGPCLKELPDLGEISREYQGQGVQLVGLIADVGSAKDATALGIVEKTQADYTHIVAAGELRTGILSKTSAVPTTIFVDKNGNQVGQTVIGSRSKADWISIIENAKKELQ